jgi:hypothetical protein
VKIVFPIFFTKTIFNVLWIFGCAGSGTCPAYKHLIHRSLRTAANIFPSKEAVSAVFGGSRRALPEGTLWVVGKRPM